MAEEEDPLADARRDLRLQERIAAALTERKNPSLRQLTVTANQGTVTLSGNVRSFYDKQLSVHCVQRIPGVKRLIDITEVVPAKTFEDPQNISRAAIGGVAILLLVGIVALAATSRDTNSDRLPVFPLKGHVDFNGKAVPGAVVMFHPKGAPQQPHPRGKVDEQGNFTLTTYEPSDGAPPGEYLVTVEWPQLHMEGGDAHYVNALPAEYLSVNTTKLQATVFDQPENRIQLALRGPAGAH